MTDRKTLDQMTSDDLDQLYERAETAERLTAHLAHALSNTFELPIDDVMTEAHNAIAAAWRTTDA